MARSPEQGNHILGRDIGLEVVGRGQHVTPSLPQQADAPFDLGLDRGFILLQGLFDVDSTPEAQFLPVSSLDPGHVHVGERLQAVENVHAQVNQAAQERLHVAVGVEQDFGLWRGRLDQANCALPGRGEEAVEHFGRNQGEGGGVIVAGEFDDVQVAASRLEVDFQQAQVDVGHFFDQFQRKLRVAAQVNHETIGFAQGAAALERPVGVDGPAYNCVAGLFLEKLRPAAKFIAVDQVFHARPGIGIQIRNGNPLAMAALEEGETVLDIGSGGGLDAFIAARRVGKTGQVIGVDMTPAMLERARLAAGKGGFTNVDFRQGYAEKLPVDNGVADVIISNCVINLAEDKAVVFREAYRALKPGGRLEVNDVVFGGAILPVERASAFGWAECISGALPEQEYVDLVKQAGFKDISVRRSTSAGASGGAPIYSVQVSARK